MRDGILLKARHPRSRTWYPVRARQIRVLVVMSQQVRQGVGQALVLSFQLRCGCGKEVDAVQRSLQAIWAVAGTAATAAVVRRQTVGGRHGVRDVGVWRRDVWRDMV